MKVTLSIEPRAGQQPNQRNLTSEDINIIYTALLHYERELSDKCKIRQAEKSTARYKASGRIHKLSEVFRRCGGETDGIYAL